jgi:CBS domain containing-hemolysin-like protein
MIYLIVALFLLIEGFFSGSELALLSVDKLQLKKRAKANDLGAQRALKLLKNPENILSTTLFVTSTCVMAISVLLTLEFRRIHGDHGELRAVMLGSGLVIIFGELIPKYFYRKFSAELAPKVATPIFYMQKILSPFIQLSSIYTSQITRIMKPIEQIWMGKKQGGKDDLQVLLTANSSETQIKTSEKKLIKKILKFRDKISKDGLVPLVQVDAIERSAVLREAFELFDQKKHSRLPVYDERVDNIIGIIELSNVITAPELNQEIESFIKPVQYVAETQKLEMILNGMIEHDHQLAVVVDEYGGAVGILTREDIFEQIVGDIQDEDDPETKLIRAVETNHWIIKAKTTISQINEELAIQLPEGDYDTLSGFLLRQFSRIPENGDELFFDTPAGQIHFVVKEATSRRIESVGIERIIAES